VIPELSDLSFEAARWPALDHLGGQSDDARFKIIRKPRALTRARVSLRGGRINFFEGGLGDAFFIKGGTIRYVTVRYVTRYVTLTITVTLLALSAGRAGFHCLSNFKDIVQRKALLGHDAQCGYGKAHAAFFDFRFLRTLGG